MLAALLGAGCDGGDDGAAVEAIAGPGERGSLVWALEERPLSLDPLFAESAAEQLVTRQIHEPLIAELGGPFEGRRRVAGLALAARPSNSGTVWRLRLRRGVQFGDGEPFNASSGARQCRTVAGLDRGFELLGELLVDAPRPDLVRFILGEPDPGFAETLASPRLGLVSPRAIAAAAGGELEASAATESGTGPFELRERSADSLLLAVNGDWWGGDRNLGPGLDQLEFRAVADPEQRFEALEQGAVQVASQLHSTQLRRVSENPLLTVIEGPAQLGLGVERSVRGIPADAPTPPLNGVSRTGIDGG